MSEALRLCSLSVCRQPAPDPRSSRSAGGSWGWGYELLLQQDLEDGLYHEPGETPQTLRLQASCCRGWGLLSGRQGGAGCACWLQVGVGTPSMPAHTCLGCRCLTLWHWSGRRRRA
jgi:hypothetical protein